MIRSVTAWSALLTVLFWVLMITFVLDVNFELDVTQRLIVFVIGGGVLIWGFSRFTAPLLGIRESLEQIALLVDRQQKLDSDLIAALQFESADAVNWGSGQLENAVVGYVAQLGSGLNVFEGLPRDQMRRRLTVAALTLLFVALGAIALPGHARVFFNRLCLGAMHYPSDTVIHKIVINHRPVMERQQDGAQPTDSVCAEGHPLEFLIQCSGDLPEEGTIRVKSHASGRRRPVSLSAITLPRRLQRLEKAKQRITDALDDSQVDVSEPWVREIEALTSLEIPGIGDALHAALEDRAKLVEARKSIEDSIGRWPGDAPQTAIFLGQLRRFVDEVSYKVYVGDAWTDSADIRMIPLPAVEPRLTPNPPLYARSATKQPADPSARHLSVIEGSDVGVSIQCTNKKRLTQAWLVSRVGEKSTRHQLEQQDDAGEIWSLEQGSLEQGPGQSTVFRNIRNEIRFEIQVTDSDGLNLETPIRGHIRLKADRAPVGTASLVHKVVVPEASPVLEYRVSDDYGVSTAKLHVEVQLRPDSTPQTLDALDQVVEAPKHEPVVLLDRVLSSDQLPFKGEHELSLSPYGLQKGDRLKLTLEVIDYRGDHAGKSYLSDPLVLEVSDESGVLAAIAEADERTEQRLTDIIKRQLGIGESP